MALVPANAAQELHKSSSKAQEGSHKLETELGQLRDARSGLEQQLLQAQGGGAAQGEHAEVDVTALQQNQRERLLARAEVLEANLEENVNELQCSKASAERLQQDNVRLYAKVKYLQEYSGSLPERDQSVTRYKSQYEDKNRFENNAWEQFTRREKNRGAMGRTEKMAYFVSTRLYATKFGRIVCIVYLASLHLLVMFLMWHISTGHLDFPGKSVGNVRGAIKRPHAHAAHSHE